MKPGNWGGFVEKENNLSHEGNAWIYGDAKVYGNAEVCGNACIYGDAKVYGNAEVCGNACIYGNADYATAKGFGSEFRSTTFFRLRDGNVGVKCGCFHGTLGRFREKVKATYPTSKKGKEYLMLADLMEYRFGDEESEGDT